MNRTLKRTLIAVLFSAPVCSALGRSAGDTIANGIGRGFVNVITSPVELPHYMVRDTADNGGWGLMTGFCRGLGYSLGRCLSGVTDLVSLGFISDSNGPYNAFGMKQYIWEERWMGSGTADTGPTGTATTTPAQPPPAQRPKETLYLGNPEQPVEMTIE
ncbi:hypothetical protein GX586_06365 [bacterium]|nr:hypothetical protein [bacterium]